jgi:predicted RNA-binding Zn ribbon-like protein
VNTVGGRVAAAGARRSGGLGGGITRDDLPDYDSLLRWSVFASLVEPRETARVRDQVRRSPSAARRVLERARRFREALYRIAKALIEAWPPSEADLRILDRELREARKNQRLVALGGRLESDWIRDRSRLDRVLWPIALSAAGVFGSDDVKRLKQCGGDRCGWLFLDTTRNHSRQWCRMADCGNVAKVRRFRRRQRRSAGRRR